MNPFKVSGPALISFSGGRSSGFMLKKILNAHRGKLPKDVYVVFANTGKEVPETLQFVYDCEQKWNVKIHWLEFKFDPNNRPKYTTVEVDFFSASRNGEPFSELIEAKKFLPNPMMRFCTQELKVRRMRDFMKGKGFDVWDNIIGIRHDEPRRWSRIRAKQDPWDNVMPMVDGEITKEHIKKFWQKNDFDLNLTMQDGSTAASNCDLCFLKGLKIRSNLIKERPHLAKWWIDQEKKIGATFRRDQISYVEIIEHEKNQPELFDTDQSMACFCHD